MVDTSHESVLPHKKWGGAIEERSLEEYLCYFAEYQVLILLGRCW